MKNIDNTGEVFAQTTRNVLKINSMCFVAALVAVLASFAAAPNAALATAPQHPRSGTGLLPTQSRRSRSDGSV
jgi:hypothetical protein